ncbi:MAG: hypothetical protein IPI85_03050 [Dehalococcoidia bacterium]|nr:hypothetical protein [Dehalococcoidia bacterium]
MTTATLPSGTGIVSTNSYDNADRLTGITHVKGGSTTVASVAYTLDQVGNRTQRVDQQGTHTYAYDDLYRLTSVTFRVRRPRATPLALWQPHEHDRRRQCHDVRLRRRGPDHERDAAEPGQPDLLHLGRQREPHRARERQLLVGLRGPHGLGHGELGDDKLRLPRGRPPRLPRGQWRRHDAVHLGRGRRAAGRLGRRQPVRLRRRPDGHETVGLLVLLPGGRPGLDDGHRRQLRQQPEVLHLRCLRRSDALRRPKRTSSTSPASRRMGRACSTCGLGITIR